MTRLLKRFWPYLTLVGAWFIFFWRFAAPAEGDRLAYPAGDFSQQYGVFRDIAYRSLVAGRFPLWADCLWAGYPFQADSQAQLFYPPVWIGFGILRLQGWGHYPLDALAAEAIFHYLFLSVGLFIFLSALSLRRPAAVLGALVFTYGGYLTGSPPLHTDVLEANAWLAPALYFADRLAGERRARHLALAALMLALAFLAGHPQTFLYMALLVIAYGSWRARRAGWSWQAWLLTVTGLVALTGGLTAVQLLPSLHYILNSTRASVAFAQSGHGFPFEDVVQFFITGLVSYWHPLYVGLLPLGLAFFALGRRLPAVRFWAGAALIALVLSLGAKAAAYDAAYWLVPGYRLFRSQERIAVVVSFALAVLAAYGADAMLGPLTRPARRRLQSLMHAAGVLLAVSFGALVVVTYLARLGIDPSDWKKLPDRVGVLVLGSGLGLVVLAVRARVPALRRWPAAMMLAAVMVDLFAANRPLNVVPAFDPFPPRPELTAVAADTAGFFRVQDDNRLIGHAGCVYGYRAVEGVTPYRVRTYTSFLEHVPERVRWPLLGVKYLVTWRPELFDDTARRVPGELVAEGTAPDERGNVTRTYRIAGEPRRAFLVQRVELAADEEMVFERLADADFEPLEMVVLLQEDGAEASAALTAATDDAAGGVEVIGDIPGEISLRTGSAAAAVLVVSEAYFPGWEAVVDGKAVPVLRADGALMAVLLPAGEHKVILRYRPWILAAGGAVSVVALVVMLVLIGGRRWWSGGIKSSDGGRL